MNKLIKDAGVGFQGSVSNETLLPHNPHICIHVGHAQDLIMFLVALVLLLSPFFLLVFDLFYEPFVFLECTS